MQLVKFRQNYNKKNGSNKFLIMKIILKKYLPDNENENLRVSRRAVGDRYNIFTAHVKAITIPSLSSDNLPRHTLRSSIIYVDYTHFSPSTL